MDQQGSEQHRESASWYLERAGGARLRVAVDQFPFLIGRGGECQIQPASTRVSRIHAELKASSAAGFLFLIDRQSTNGTYLNGYEVKEPVPVNHSDVLSFGDEEWRLVQVALDRNATRQVTTRRTDLMDLQSA